MTAAPEARASGKTARIRIAGNCRKLQQHSTRFTGAHRAVETSEGRSGARGASGEHVQARSHARFSHRPGGRAHGSGARPQAVALRLRATSRRPRRPGRCCASHPEPCCRGASVRIPVRLVAARLRRERGFPPPGTTQPLTSSCGGRTWEASYGQDSASPHQSFLRKKTPFRPAKEAISVTGGLRKGGGGLQGATRPTVGANVALGRSRQRRGRVQRRSVSRLPRPRLGELRRRSGSVYPRSHRNPPPPFRK
jgi:hypothetical protein